MYCLDKLQECMFILGALFEIFRIHLLLHLEVRQSKTTPLESGKARLHLLSPAKQDYTSESGKARPNQCSLGLYTYIIVCILRIRVSESRPYRTMTYLSADLARNDSVYFETPPCSYAPLLRMRTNFFNHHVLNTSFQDLRSGMGTRQSCLQSQG